MLGNFSYVNPTKLYFGEDALSHLHEELSNYGNRILLVYGGGSIKKNGVYDAVCEILRANGKEIYEDGGVMPNPTVEKLREGCDIARKNQVDFILAVGGGSVCDYAKAVSVSIHCEEDPWEKYYLRMEDVSCEIVPVGCILTMVGIRHIRIPFPNIRWFPVSMIFSIIYVNSIFPEKMTIQAIISVKDCCVRSFIPPMQL